MTMETVAENRSFEGTQGVYKHASTACGCDMTFAVYMPPQAKNGPIPVLWFLSGLTCTHENAMVKAGAQAYAAKHGIALIFPDTSPRGEAIANDDAYDLGQGAGFYIDATEAPWAGNFNMYSYITKELPALVADNFAIDMSRQGITGHSMGGHGALTIAMKNPDTFKSVSAFSPICNPTQSDWGKKQFSAYLGDNQDTWQGHDACNLLNSAGWQGDILVTTGKADQFTELLCTNALETAAQKANISLSLNLPEGYDHSYFFISTFMQDHVEWHASRL